jgi:uncharacterized damage-inducible protein DinB
LSILNPFLANYEHEYQSTLKVLRAIPEDKVNFTPHEKMRSAGHLAWHIVAIENLFGRGTLGDKIVVGGSRSLSPPATIAAMIETYEKQHPEIVDAWKAFDESKWLEKIPFVKPNGETWMELPRIVYLQSALLAHTIHHRGQLTVLLRLMGAKVPGVYGPSADEM